MEVDDKDSGEAVSATTSVEPLDDMAPLQHALEDDAAVMTKPRPTIVRLWNKEDVERIMEASSDETITIHATCRGQTCTCRTERLPERFDIDKSLLCHFSTYFRALSFGGFAKSTEENFSFDFQPLDARIFQRWLRCGILYSWNHGCRQPCFGTLLRLYVFADYYDIPALRRAIMLEFASPKRKNGFGTQYPGFNGIQYWELKHHSAGLPTTLPFYRWLLERYTNCSRGRASRGTIMTQVALNRDFPELRDLALEVIVDNRDGRQCKCCHYPCDFHDHESEEEWKKTCYLVNKDIPKPDPST